MAQVESTIIFRNGETSVPIQSGFLIFVNTIASLNHRDSWDLESSDYRPCDVLRSRLGDTFIQALTTSLPFLPLFLIGLIIHQDLLASKVFCKFSLSFSILSVVVALLKWCLNFFFVHDDSYLDSYISTIGVDFYYHQLCSGQQQVKSVSERSPAFATEELIRDYGVGKSCLLLRLAQLQIASDRHPLTFVLKRNGAL
ncbi:hypothetical protein YC2023_112060 [Brassica napus]